MAYNENPSYVPISSQPNSIISDFDDFISCGDTKTIIGGGYSKWNWYVYNVDSFYPLVGTANNPGQFVVTNPSASQSVAIATTDGTTAAIFPFVMGGGAFNLNWVVDLGTLSNGTNRYIVYVGLGFANGSPITEPTNGIYFTYSDNVNSGNWVAKTASAGTRTTVNSSVAGSTSFVNLGIQVNASATSVTFTIDGTAFGSSTTNIPTVAIPIAFSGVATSGTYPSGTQALDIVYYTQILTTPR